MKKAKQYYLCFTVTNLCTRKMNILPKGAHHRGGSTSQSGVWVHPSVNQNTILSFHTEATAKQDGFKLGKKYQYGETCKQQQRHWWEQIILLSSFLKWHISTKLLFYEKHDQRNKFYLKYIIIYPKCPVSQWNRKGNT